MGTTTPLLPTTPTTTTCTTCSARCSTAPLTGWTTTGALTTATRWAACLTSRTCSTTCATRGPPETTSTSGTEAPHGGQDWQHDLRHEGVERLGRQQQHRCAGHEEGHPEVHDAQRVVQEQVRAPA